MTDPWNQEKHIKKERAKARVLRKSNWWKQKLSSCLCHYCQKNFPQEALTMDHKIPLSRGGTTSKGNVVVCCKGCNNEKKRDTPVDRILKSWE